MANVTDADRLRALVGEAIPETGTAADTLFTSVEIQDLLARNGDVEKALGEAWEMKAGKLSDLVDIQDGDQRRSLSQAHAQALRLAKWYYDRGQVGIAKTRIHRIQREGFQG